ncbi:glycerol-3-phosphate 1-O-acyltransferase PlsY [Priestia filamentosa]|uniref:glycerol-3-phosphate 1-O-acyltransferase PlsY n=1 Tax=Priestia filamentosa TaxID=1402861 RepID=UPI0005895720
MIVITLFLAYLVGSVPFGLIVGKAFYQTDIRQHGSGNLGATNAFRVLGKKPGSIIMLADILKGTFAACLPQILSTNLHPCWSAIAAILGHCYPLFAKFKGGKAVATTTGALLFILPVGLGVGILVFLLTLKLFKYVSLSSSLAVISIYVYVLIFKQDIYIQIFSLAISFFILYKHRANFARIRNKTEPKVSWL